MIVTAGEVMHSGRGRFGQVPEAHGGMTDDYVLDESWATTSDPLRSVGDVAMNVRCSVRTFAVA